MAYPLFNDIIQLTLEAEFDETEDVQNVFQFKNKANSFTSDADWHSDLHDLAVALVNIAKGYASIITLWKSYRVRNLTQLTPTENLFLTPNVAGVLTGDSLASGVSPMFVVRTDVPKVTLRKFWGPATENANDAGGVWSSTLMSTGASDIATLIAPFVLTKSTWQYGHFHVTSATFAEPTGGYMPSEPAYQRRRRRGRGS